MAATSLVFGERNDIEIFYGDYLSGTFTVTDSNGDAYTFPDGVASMSLKLWDNYAKDNQIGTTITGSNGLSRASEVITLAATQATLDSSSELEKGDTPYYELGIVTTTGSKIQTPSYGWATIV